MNVRSKYLAAVWTLLTYAGFAMAHDGVHDAMVGRSANEALAISPVPYVYVSHIGGMVGGRPAVSRSIYLAETGLFQVSEHGTDGRLHLLLQSRIVSQNPFPGLADMLARSLRRARVAPSPEADELAEYYPARTLIAFRLPDGEHKFESIPKDGLPEVLGRLVRALDDLARSERMQPAEPGIFLRSHPYPGSVPKSAVHLSVRDLQGDQRLARILTNELAIVRGGDSDETPIFASKLLVLPNHPVIVEAGGRVYQLTAYRLDPS